MDKSESRSSRKLQNTSLQLNLFDQIDRAPDAPQQAHQRRRQLSPPVALTCESEDGAAIIDEKDMPAYSQALKALVDASIAELPPLKLWFTYRDIGARFGISRATIARRVKDGLVPGVRMVDGRVLEDGPVRRFDRRQLRYLLLAVRRRAHHAPLEKPAPAPPRGF